MIVWRLCRAKRRSEAFTGEGARLAGGRWNPKGTPVVYTAESLALAAIELFVHLDPAELAAAYVSFPVSVPGDLPIQRVDVKTLPRNWRDTPAPPELARIGRQWVDGAQTAILQAPSAVVPQESVLVLNPAHPDFARIQVGKAQPFEFDPRFRKS
ncbi:MAG: RES family NAD+ phosphorylase [Thermodesulfobacteriota bacterium]|jgi:RES domain-containing protein